MHQEKKMLKIRPIIISMAAISVLQAGVLDGIFSGKVDKPDISKVVSGVKDSAGSNLLQGAAAYVPDEVMQLCYDFKPKVTTAKSGICGFLKGGIDPCSVAPDLTLYGYTKKRSDPYFKKELESLKEYCEAVTDTAVKKVSLPEAVKGYDASGNLKAADPKNSDAIYGNGGILDWNNIKAYSSNGKDYTNNYYLYKAASTNDYLSFKYYEDVLDNSVGTGSGVRSKVNVFSPKELKDATVSYKNIKDYNTDVKKIATVLKTSTGQSSSGRISSVGEAEMRKAEFSANASGSDASLQKEAIAGSKIDEISDAVDKDVEYKTKFYSDITVNPNNRIVYPAKGYVDSLPPEKKVVAVKKIELQAKKDAMLRASFEEIGDMRKELAHLVMENAKISSRQFNAAAAQAEINALIK